MVLDLGAFSTEPVDYPDYARVVGQAVLRDFVEAGVLVCGSGVGAAIAANKIRGVRAAPCADAAAALESRQQLDANVLCLSANALDDGAAIEVTLTWIGAKFSGDEAHARQVAKLAQLEAGPVQERAAPRPAPSPPEPQRAAESHPRGGSPRAGIRRIDVPGRDIHRRVHAPRRGRRARGFARARPRDGAGGARPAPPHARCPRAPRDRGDARLPRVARLPRSLLGEGCLALARGRGGGAQSTGLAHVARRDARPRRGAAGVRRRDPAPAVQSRGRPRRGRVVPRRAGRVWRVRLQDGIPGSLRAGLPRSRRREAHAGQHHAQPDPRRRLQQVGDHAGDPRALRVLPKRESRPRRRSRVCSSSPSPTRARRSRRWRPRRASGGPS